MWAACIRFATNFTLSMVAVTAGGNAVVRLRSGESQRAGVSARFFVKGSQSHDLAKLAGLLALQVWWPLSAGVPPTGEPGHQSLEVRRAQSVCVQ